MSYAGKSLLDMPNVYFRSSAKKISTKVEALFDLTADFEGLRFAAIEV